MSDVVISVRNLGKRYNIGRLQRRHDTLRDAIMDNLRSPIRWLRRNGGDADPTTQEAFWAVQDLSFDIQRGEVVGIIGRNGAGKTTLMKLLSRITEPTTGEADIHGRVGTLLEVGTGFHPELTGRENIYLSGAILGMKKREIDRKFDEIVAFAEVEKFIGTPVKHYSSGMYVRLAFGVAAHLETEILLVDEVLAVGDTLFQKKCLGKMGQVAKEGRTVLFISHNMGQIRNLCNRGLWIDQGHLVREGSITDVVSAYQQQVAVLSRAPISGNGNAPKYSGFTGWKILNPGSEGPFMRKTSDRFTLQVELRLAQSVHNAHHGLVLHSADGQRIAGWGIYGLALKPGTHTIQYEFPYLPVRPGSYTWYASLWDGAQKIDTTYLYPEFMVVTEDYSGMSEEWAGMMNMPIKITVEAAEELAVAVPAA